MKNSTSIKKASIKECELNDVKFFLEMLKTQLKDPKGDIVDNTIVYRLDNYNIINPIFAKPTRVVESIHSIQNKAVFPDATGFFIDYSRNVLTDSSLYGLGVEVLRALLKAKSTFLTQKSEVRSSIDGLMCVSFIGENIPTDIGFDISFNEVVVKHIISKEKDVKLVSVCFKIDSIRMLNFKNEVIEAITNRVFNVDANCYIHVPVGIKIPYSGEFVKNVRENSVDHALSKNIKSIQKFYNSNVEVK